MRRPLRGCLCTQQEHTCTRNNTKVQTRKNNVTETHPKTDTMDESPIRPQSTTDSDDNARPLRGRLCLSDEDRSQTKH